MAGGEGMKDLMCIIFGIILSGFGVLMLHLGIMAIKEAIK